MSTPDDEDWEAAVRLARAFSTPDEPVVVTELPAWKVTACDLIAFAGDIARADGRATIRRGDVDAARRLLGAPRVKVT